MGKEAIKNQKLLEKYGEACQTKCQAAYYSRLFKISKYGAFNRCWLNERVNEIEETYPGISVQKIYYEDIKLSDTPEKTIEDVVSKGYDLLYVIKAKHFGEELSEVKNRVLSLITRGVAVFFQKENLYFDADSEDSDLSELYFAEDEVPEGFVVVKADNFRKVSRKIDGQYLIFPSKE